MTAVRAITRISDADDYGSLTDPVVGVAGLRSLGTGAQQALDVTAADKRYGRPAAGAVIGIIPSFVPAIATAAAANVAYGLRVTIPFTGVLHDVSVCSLIAQSGNHMLGVYDTGGTRTRLAESASMTVTYGWNTWDPALAVTAGQQLDLVHICDNATAQFLRVQLTDTPAAELPAGFDPVTGGALPKTNWQFSVGSFTLPATVTEAQASHGVTARVFVARVA